MMRSPSYAAQTVIAVGNFALNSQAPAKIPLRTNFCHAGFL